MRRRFTKDDCSKSNRMSIISMLTYSWLMEWEDSSTTSQIQMNSMSISKKSIRCSSTWIWIDTTHLEISKNRGRSTTWVSLIWVIRPWLINLVQCNREVIWCKLNKSMLKIYSQFSFLPLFITPIWKQLMIFLFRESQLWYLQNKR